MAQKNMIVTLRIEKGYIYKVYCFHDTEYLHGADKIVYC